MKLSIPQERLHSLLQSVTSAAQTQADTMAILRNVHLDAAKGALVATCTNLELTLIARCEVIDMGEEGKVTVPAKLLQGISGSLKGGKSIELELQEDQLAVRSGRYSGRLETLRPEDFPQLDLDNGAQEVSMPSALLSGMLSETHFAMAQSDPRYYLNGMLMEISEEGLRLVATDGHRLSCSHTSECRAGAESRGIVPRNSINALRPLLPGSEEVQLALGENQVRFRLGDRQMTSKLVEGRYPEYRRVIPERLEKPLLANRVALETALSRVALVARESRGVRDQRIPLVSIAVKENTIGISTEGGQGAEAQDEVEVQYHGPEIKVGFNAIYLTDVLRSLQSDEVEMHMRDGNSSVLICAPDKAGVQHIVMPMRL
ncbi:DNA polymerase III subunit beta [Candidatus Foliamicus sp.]